MPRPEREAGGEVLEKPKPKTRKPRLFHVVLHNDDYTTMEFVVSVLESIFGPPTPVATRIMLSVHHRGVGVAGVYPHEIAESKAQKAIAMARAAEFPLLATVEAE